MVVFPVLAVSLIMKVVAAMFVLCAIALVLIILIQKGKGGGLSGAFAGGMAGGILGSKTGDFLTWFTVALVGLFLLLAVIMAKFYRPTVSGPGADQFQPPVQQQQSQPVIPPAGQGMPRETGLPGE